MKKLSATGERMMPESMNAVIQIEHLHRYALALQFCAGKDVLDIASGEGYGSNLLSQTARSVLGVDIDNDSVYHASDKYKKPNLKFKQGTADAIPLEDGSVDVVVSFETLEHHDKHREMMREVKRVLRPGGIFILSTPDKKYYSDIPNYKNPFHVKELYSKEFFELVSEFFPFVQKIGQSSGMTSVLFPIDHEYLKDTWTAGGDDTDLKVSGSLPALYLIAIAGQTKIDYAPISVFDGTVLWAKANDLEQKAFIKDIYNSSTYRLGHFLLSPFKWIRNKIRKTGNGQ